MVQLSEVADMWVTLGLGHSKQGNLPHNSMEYFLSCTKTFNPQYHIHLLTFENGKAKLKSAGGKHTVLMENINSEIDPVTVALKLYVNAGYNTNSYCDKTPYFFKYLKYKKKYLQLRKKIQENN